MKIVLNAHLLSRRAGYRSAGIHGYIYNLLRHLPAQAPEGWSLTAMVGAGSPHRFDGLDMRLAPWDTEYPVRRILWEQTLQPFALPGYDLYHAMSFVSPLILPRPSVVTVYDLSFVHYPQVLSAARRWYLRLFTALSCRRAARVTAISHSTARDLNATFGISMDKIDVAVCGYDTARFHPLPAEKVEAFRRAQGLPERFWLFIGTLEPRKNLPTLIEAYAQLPRDERLPLVLAGGKGWLYDEIFAAVERHQLQDDIHFPGFVSAESLPLWYNSAEVFVYPSIYEGFGLPVLEAMACGTPVIISDASSLPEVAGAAGNHVPPRDTLAWADALHRALQDAAWREQERGLSLTQAQRFDWRETARITIDSYQKALKLAVAESV